MSLLVKMRQQDAIYWPPSVVSDDFGRKVPETPVQLKVRWEDYVQEMIDPDGNTYVSKAEIYVGQDVKIGGIMMLGLLTDTTIDLKVPMNNEGAYEIKGYEKCPAKIRTTKKFLRIAYL